MCVDLTAVDYLAYAGRPLPDGITAERFEVVVNFLDIEAGRRVRVRVQVPADDPTLPTLFDLHPGTEAMEREVYDMFGITFTDHPDLTRILMPEDWEGHPLRKDYEIGAIPVQFKEAELVTDVTPARCRTRRWSAETAEEGQELKPRSRGDGQGAAARGRRRAADERGRGGRSSATCRTTPTRTRR